MALFGLGKQKKKRAGLFIDRGYFRYLAVVGLPGSFVVTDSFAGEISEEVSQGSDPFSNNGTFLFRVMNEVLHSVGTMDVPVRLSLPTTDSLLRVVNFPNMSMYEAKLAFRYEFENYFPFPVEEGVFDLAEIYYPLQNGTEEPRYLVGAARKTLIENITKAAKSNGIEITAIEPAHLALERAVTPITPVTDAAVYIYAGKIKSVLIFSWKNNGIFYRTMSIGFTGITFVDESFNEQLSVEFNAFAKEVHSSLQFALSQIRGFKPDMFFLFGPGASQELCEFLKESLSIPEMMVSDPVSLHGLEFDKSAGMWDIPVGLVLR